LLNRDTDEDVEDGTIWTTLLKSILQVKAIWATAEWKK